MGKVRIEKVWIAPLVVWLLALVCTVARLDTASMFFMFMIPMSMGVSIGIIERQTYAVVSFLVMAIIFSVVFIASVCTAPAANDALAEVNNQRARAGLFPFVYDEGLTQAASRVADVRAARHIQFHCNDFQYLPSGVNGSGIVSGAGVSSNKFMACYTEYPRRMGGEASHGGIPGVQGNTVYAGAAVAYDSSGQRYCHLFVSGRPSGIVSRIRNAIDAVLCPMASHRIYGLDAAPAAYTPPVQVVSQPIETVSVGEPMPSQHTRRKLFSRLRSR